MDLHMLKRYKTQMCKRMLSGSCRFGTQCHFAHDEKELRRDLDKQWYLGARCERADCAAGDCSYAHNDNELQYHPHVYKTRLCYEHTKPGGCPRKRYCSFAHGRHELHPKFDTAAGAGYAYDYVPTLGQNQAAGEAAGVGAEQQHQGITSPYGTIDALSSTATHFVPPGVIAAHRGYGGGNGEYGADAYFQPSLSDARWPVPPSAPGVAFAYDDDDQWQSAVPGPVAAADMVPAAARAAAVAAAHLPSATTPSDDPMQQQMVEVKDRQAIGVSSAVRSLDDRHAHAVGSLLSAIEAQEDVLKTLHLDLDANAQARLSAVREHVTTQLAAVKTLLIEEAENKQRTKASTSRCIVCMSRPVTCVLSPCNHAVCCELCLERACGWACPQCHVRATYISPLSSPLHPSVS